PICIHSSFFFYTSSTTTNIYTLSLHDALPIFFSFSGISVTNASVVSNRPVMDAAFCSALCVTFVGSTMPAFTKSVKANIVDPTRSEEHTSELQSLRHLVCRLLLEKKKKTAVTT